MSFSDEDLKRLKYHVIHSGKFSDSFIANFDAFLARLEAAEKYIDELEGMAAEYVEPEEANLLRTVSNAWLQSKGGK